MTAKHSQNPYKNKVFGMTQNVPATYESIAGVRADVVSALPPDDIAFLRLLASMGLTLDSVYERISQKNDIKR